MEYTNMDYMDKMGLRGIESKLPPGFRFYPSDEELVCHYLYNKVTNIQTTFQPTMVEVDLHTREPWELPDGAKLTATEWYLFSFRDRKYTTGSRTNRATKSGYWKATGKDKSICKAKTRAVVGMRKTLVFYRGRAPHGIKTAWVMHEFRLHTPHSPPKEDWVLCRVSNKTRNRDDDAATASSSLALPIKQDIECYSTTLMQVQQQQHDEDHCSKLDVRQAFLNMEAFLLIDQALVEENMGSDDQLGFLQATMDDDMGFHEQQQQQIIMGEEMMRFQFPRWQG